MAAVAAPLEPADLKAPIIGQSVAPKDPTATFTFLKGQVFTAPFNGLGVEATRAQKLVVQGQDLQTCNTTIKTLTMNVESANLEPAWYASTPAKIGAGVILGLILGKLLEIKY